MNITESVKLSAKEKESKKALCIICEEKEAEFCIKGIPKNCYCMECAIEQFGDVEVLEKLDY